MLKRPSALWLRARATYALFALLVAPLILVQVWGRFLPAEAYVAFAYARNLAAGRALTYGLAIAAPTSPLRAPLYVLALALLERLRVPLLEASMVLSALGWGTTALVLFRVGRAIGRPVAAVTSAVLAILNPWLLSTTGTETAWALALFWIAVLSALKGRWQILSGVLVLLLWTHFAWFTLALALAFLGLQWFKERRCPLRSTIVTAIAAAAWILISTQLPGIPFPLSWPRSLALPSFSALKRLGQLFAQSDFYWLSLPWIALGLGVIRRKATWAAAMGGWIALAGDGATAEASSLVMGLFLAGLGIDSVVRWVEARDLNRTFWVRFVGAHLVCALDSASGHRHTVALRVVLALIASSPLVSAQASVLWRHYQSRPLARQAIEQQAGEWLSSQGAPGATVFSSGRLGYLADRPVVLWEGKADDLAQMSAVMDALNAYLPEYCISSNTIAWDWLMRTNGFGDRYERVKSFETAYDSASPFTVWRYRRSGFDRGEFWPVDVLLPGGIQLMGYRYWPERIEPGDSVYVTLFFRASRSVNSAFRAVLRVFSPNEGENWAHVDQKVPRSVPIDWWQVGQVIPERFVMTTTAETPVGAYRLDLAVLESDVKDLALGYVAVPWQGDLGPIAPVEARFSDEISLIGYRPLNSVVEGTELEVTLYWEALRRPDDNYVAFVHLVGPDGQMLANHDGEPMDRRYPTRAWIPGEIVPDTHRLSVNPSAPPGTYTLKVGMYRWPSLERLPAWYRDGAEQPERAVTLQSIEIR